MNRAPLGAYRGRLPNPALLLEGSRRGQGQGEVAQGWREAHREAHVEVRARSSLDEQGVEDADRVA